MVSTFKLYRKDPDTGLPTMVPSDPNKIPSSFGNASLVEDLTSSLASKYYVDTLIDEAAVIRYKGRVDSEADLPTEGQKEGNFYLVGIEGSEEFEEFIYTGDAWDRMGTIRSGDVDLSAYATTDSLTSSIGDMQTAIQGGITDMDTATQDAIGATNTAITEAISDAESKYNESMGGLTKELIVLNDVPVEWPADMADTGMLFVKD